MYEETPAEKVDCLAWVQEAGFPKGICPRCGWPTVPQDYHGYGECISPPRVERPVEYLSGVKWSVVEPYGAITLCATPLVALQSGTVLSAAPSGSAAQSPVDATSSSPTVQAAEPTQLSAALQPDNMDKYLQQVLDMVHRCRRPPAEVNLQPTLGPEEDPDEHAPKCMCKFCTTVRDTLHLGEEPIPGGITRAMCAEACKLIPEASARMAEAERNLVFGPNGPQVIRLNNPKGEDADD